MSLISSGLQPLPALPGVPPEFVYPPYYSFPPFFTPQPHELTFNRQVEMWLALIRDYCRATRTFCLSLPGTSFPLFTNTTINRSLPADFIQSILRQGRKTELLIWASDQKAVAKQSEKNKMYVMWRSLDFWCDLVCSWAVTSAVGSTVLTGYEVRCGDSTAKYEFHDMDEGLFRHVVFRLEKTAKIIMVGARATSDVQTDMLGFKFLV